MSALYNLSCPRKALSVRLTGVECLSARVCACACACVCLCACVWRFACTSCVHGAFVSALRLRVRLTREFAWVHAFVCVCVRARVQVESRSLAHAGAQT